MSNPPERVTIFLVSLGVGFRIGTVTIAERQEFRLRRGRVIGGKYVVEEPLGIGWEGEVYRVTERTTGATRAVKLFHPQRNLRDRRLTRYAQKLERLRPCSIVMQYHHSEPVQVSGQKLNCLVSEFVEGEMLPDYVRRHRGGRLEPFRALHLVHTLAVGLAEIHDHREYHGDLHAENILVRPRGIFFDVKVLDLYDWAGKSSEARRDDVVDLVSILFEITGGRPRYAGQPKVVKEIVRGLRRDLILKRFPTMHRLRRWLETFAWG